MNSLTTSAPNYCRTISSPLFDSNIAILCKHYNVENLKGKEKPLCGVCNAHSTQTQIPKKYIPCAVGIPVEGASARRTAELLGSTQAMMQCSAGTTGHARVCLIAQDHLARRILSNLVQETLSETIMCPGVHRASGA